MSQLTSQFATAIRETDRLTLNTPDLSDDERDSFFGHLTANQRGQVADLFWACETPEQRERIYNQLRRWAVEAEGGAN